MDGLTGEFLRYRIRPWGGLEKCNVRSGPGRGWCLPWDGEDLKMVWFCVTQTFGMLPWRRGNGFIRCDLRSKCWNIMLYVVIRYRGMFTFARKSCARKRKSEMSARYGRSARPRGPLATCQGCLPYAGWKVACRTSKHVIQCVWILKSFLVNSGSPRNLKRRKEIRMTCWLGSVTYWI